MLSKLFSRCLIASSLVGLSTVSMAQLEVVTPALTSQYQLDFSDPTPMRDRYEVKLGSSGMIALGYNVTLGALYLYDRVNQSVELLSKNATGDPVLVEQNGMGYGTNFEASEDLNTIVYVSEDPNIVIGDSGDSQDVFIYNRSTGLTERVEGNHPHEGEIMGLRISPAGDHLAFKSSDRDFGVLVGSNPIQRVIYVYDLNSDYLATVPNTVGNEYFQLQLLGPSTVAFTLDSQHLFYRLSSDFDYPGADELYIYNLASGETNLFAYSNSFSRIGSLPRITALSDNYYLYSVGELDIDVFPIAFLSIYDLMNQQDLPFPADLGKIDSNTIFDGQSADKRYAVFHATVNDEFFINDNAFNPRAGVVWVMDTQTGEFREAFSPVRTALYHEKYNDNFDLYPCETIFTLNDAFYQTPVLDLPCNFIDNSFDPLTRDEYISTAEAFFDINTKEVRLHNDDQYITFEGNAWYFDDSIAYEDFTTSQVQARETYVVANPFLVNGSIDLLGRPDVDRSTETGTFIWRTADGRTVVQMVAGDAAQNGQSTTFEGSIVSAASIGSLTSISIESSDSLVQTAMNRLDFDLVTQRPWEDRFSFVADNAQSLCVDLTNYAGGLYLGPDRVEVTPPYDINGLDGCSVNPVIETMGRPTFDRSADTGIFIWENQSNDWVAHVVSGDQQRVVEVDVDSSSAISNVQQVSIESSDVFTQLPNGLDMSLNVTAPWLDGFKFTDQSQATTCISTTNADVPIYVGPDRVNVGMSIDLETLTDCQ